MVEAKDKVIQLGGASGARKQAADLVKASAGKASAVSREQNLPSLGRGKKRRPRIVVLRDDDGEDVR